MKDIIHMIALTEIKDKRKLLLLIQKMDFFDKVHATLRHMISRGNYIVAQVPTSRSVDQGCLMVIGPLNLVYIHKT